MHWLAETNSRPQSLLTPKNQQSCIIGLLPGWSHVPIHSPVRQVLSHPSPSLQPPANGPAIRPPAIAPSSASPVLPCDPYLPPLSPLALPIAAFAQPTAPFARPLASIVQPCAPSAQPTAPLAPQFAPPCTTVPRRCATSSAHCAIDRGMSNLRNAPRTPSNCHCFREGPLAPPVHPQNVGLGPHLQAKRLRYDPPVG